MTFLCFTLKQREKSHYYNNNNKKFILFTKQNEYCIGNLNVLIDELNIILCAVREYFTYLW